MKMIKLRNGFEVSAVGFGTYPLKVHQLLRTVPNLSQYGITLVDTAHDYKNESLIGLAGLFNKESIVYSTKMSVKQQRARNGGYTRGVFYRASST